MQKRRVSPWFLAGLLALAVAVRWVAWLQVEVIPRDGIYFLHQAHLFLQGDWTGALAGYQHPLFAALTAGVHRICNLDLETAGAWVALVSGALAVVPLAGLMGRVYGAGAAGLLYAVLPLAVRFTARPLSEGPLYLFLFLAALAGHQVLVQPGRATAFVAGLAGGLAYLARPEGLAAPAITLVGLVVFPAVKAFWPRFLAVVFLGLGLALTVGPYAGYLSVEAGTLRLTAKKDIRVLAGVKEDRPVQPLSDEGLADNAPAAARALGRHLLESMSYAPVVLALIGLLFPGRKRRTRSEVFLGLFLLVFGLALFRLASTYGYLARRHTLTPGLFLLGWSGAGMVWVAARTRKPTAVFVVLSCLVCGGLMPFALKAVDRDHLPERTLGEWILAHEGPGQAIAPMGYPRVAYYAKADPLDILARHQGVLAKAPAIESFAALEAELRRHRVRLILHSSRQARALGRWIETHSTLLHRVPYKGEKWWSVRVLSWR